MAASSARRTRRTPATAAPRGSDGGVGPPPPSYDTVGEICPAVGREIRAPGIRCSDCRQGMVVCSGCRRHRGAGGQRRPLIWRERGQPCDRIHALLPNYLRGGPGQQRGLVEHNLTPLVPTLGDRRFMAPIPLSRRRRLPAASCSLRGAVRGRRGGWEYHSL